MDLAAALEAVLSGLGYEMVDLERQGRGLLRVFIDKPEGVTLDDCVLVSNHLTRWFAVEGVDYDRLEVSSPGLDRPLKKQSDFMRFSGEKAQVRLRVALAGRRNFVGILRGVEEGCLRLEVGGEVLSLDLSNLDKARLVPNI